MARLTVYGAGGAVRNVRRLTVYGAGGVARNVSRAWVYGAGGTPRLFFSGGGQFQLTAGNILGVTVGYQAAPLAGVVVPNPAILSGMTVSLLGSAVASNIIRLSAVFPTNPGQNRFTTLTIAPIWFGNTASATYSYGGTTATWDWVTTTKLVVGANYTVSAT